MKKLLFSSIGLIAFMFIVPNVFASISFSNHTFGGIDGNYNTKILKIVNDTDYLYALIQSDNGTLIIKTDLLGNILVSKKNEWFINCPTGQLKSANITDMAYSSYTNEIFISGSGIPSTDGGSGIWKLDPNTLSIIWNRTTQTCYTVYSQYTFLTTDNSGNAYMLNYYSTGGSDYDFIRKFRNSDGLPTTLENRLEGYHTGRYNRIIWNNYNQTLYYFFSADTSNLVCEKINVTTATYTQKTNLYALSSFSGDIIADNNGFIYIATNDYSYPTLHLLKLNYSCDVINTNTISTSYGNPISSGIIFDNTAQNLYVAYYDYYNETHVAQNLDRFNSSLYPDLTFQNIAQPSFNSNGDLVRSLIEFDSNFFLTGLYSLEFSGNPVIRHDAQLFYWGNITGGQNITDVNLTVLPKSADYSGIYTFYVNITGGSTHYNISLFVDGFNILFGNISSNYYTYGGGGFGIGNHTSYIIITDWLYGTSKTSNIDWFYTNQTGMIAPVILTVTPLTANPFTIINFSTSAIYNGTASYTVQIKAHEVGGHIVATCYNILENGNCNGTFSGSDLFNTGNIPITAIVTDAVGHTTQSTTPSISFTKEVLGNPLIIDFSVNPTTNKTTDDLYKISLNFTGSRPPFLVEFRDTNGLICSYSNTYTTKFNLYLYFYSGGHYLNAIVYGADGQVNMSNFGYTDKLYYEIEQAGNVFQLRNRVINCLGTLGDSNNNVVYTGEEATQYGGNYTETQSTQPTNIIGFANSFVSIMTSPMTIWTILILVIGFTIEATAKWKFGGKAVAIVFIIGATLLAIRGIYPTWFLIIEVVIVALVIAFMVKKGQSG